MDTRHDLLRLWNDHRYRRSLSAGIIGFGPWRLVLAVALAGGIAYAVVFPLVSRLVLCVNDTLDGAPCNFEVVSPKQWFLWFGTGTLLAGGFFVVDRISVWRRWTLVIGDHTRLTFAHLWSTITVPVVTLPLTFVINTALSHVVGVTLIVSAVIFRMLGSLRWLGIRITMLYCSDRCVTWAIRDYLCHRHGLFPNCVEIDVSDRNIKIKGPFDAINEGQIRYMLETDFAAPFDSAELDSTLDADAYEASLLNPLQPSGYAVQDASLPKPPEVSYWTLVLILVCGLGLMGLIFAMSGMLSDEEYSGLIDDAMRELCKWKLVCPPDYP